MTLIEFRDSNGRKALIRVDAITAVHEQNDDQTWVHFGEAAPKLIMAPISHVERAIAEALKR